VVEDGNWILPWRFDDDLASAESGVGSSKLAEGKSESGSIKQSRIDIKNHAQVVRATIIFPSFIPLIPPILTTQHAANMPSGQGSECQILTRKLRRF